jgi:hypothetical protein
MNKIMIQSEVTRIHFMRVSSNAKTGLIPVSMSPKFTCPNACELKANGCYAESGNTNIHWNRLTNGDYDKSKNVFEWSAFCDQIKALPKGQLWRMNVAGDLPSDDAVTIDHNKMVQLILSNDKRKGFTYTHYDCENIPENASIVNLANEKGFTVNLSANNTEHADRLVKLSIGPVVTIMPIDCDKVTVTPDGNTIVQCPATYREDIQCSTCGICAVSSRKAIIGFPVHGTSKAKAHKVFMMKQGV